MLGLRKPICASCGNAKATRLFWVGLKVRGGIIRTELICRGCRKQLRGLRGDDGD